MKENPLPESALRSRRLLVVEDDYFWADELSQGLRRVGAIVLGPAASINAARAFLEEQPQPDGVILDINLRGERAYAIADLLLARRVPFLIMTGYDMEALPAGYASVIRLEKPVALDAVVKAVADLLLPV
ncbi:MAG TPA: response regulator [Methylorubrum populi]|uniref:Response regulator n=1 Tax=Methylorubrum populi TaxID=223967 RepID=A0A921E6E6_9HYPH|nr:response regulator [Methylorubrum populi]